MGRFSKIYADDLPSRAISVYMCLYDHANRDGNCYPSLSTISKETKLSLRTVQRAVNDLEKAGYIRKEQRFRKNGANSSTLYFLKNPD